MQTTPYDDQANCSTIDSIYRQRHSKVATNSSSNVVSQNLLQCIHAVDRDARQGSGSVRHATWLWNYVDAVPLALGQIGFDPIRGLHFIPRHTQRHPSYSNFDVYARELPNVISLNELRALERDAIVWMHRGMPAVMIPHFRTVFAGSFRESIVSAYDTELPVSPVPEEGVAVQFVVGTQCPFLRDSGP